MKRGLESVDGVGWQPRRWGKGQFQDCFLGGGGGAPVSDFLWLVRLAKSVAIALSLDPYWHCGCCALILSGAHLWCLI